MSKNWRAADDPAIVLQRKQEGTCMGCARLNKQVWLGAVKFVCSKAVQKGSVDVYDMPRCKKFFVDRYKGNV